MDEEDLQLHHPHGEPGRKRGAPGKDCQGPVQQVRPSGQFAGRVRQLLLPRRPCPLQVLLLRGGHSGETEPGRVAPVCGHFEGLLHYHGRHGGILNNRTWDSPTFRGSFKKNQSDILVLPLKNRRIFWNRQTK